MEHNFPEVSLQKHWRHEILEKKKTNSSFSALHTRLSSLIRNKDKVVFTYSETFVDSELQVPKGNATNEDIY